MSEAQENSQTTLLTIRNMLVTLAGVLLAALLFMTWNVMDNAFDKKATAELSMELNDVADKVSQFTAAIAAERSAVGTAYGFQGLPDAAFVKQFKEQRTNANRHYSSLITTINEFDDFAGKASLVKALKEKWTALDGLGRDIESDLKVSEDSRNLRSRKVLKAQNEVVEAAHSIRSAAELTLITGNARIEAVKQLKRQLWTMREFSARDSAAIGENIASGEPLTQIKLQLVSQYGGIVRSAWNSVQEITASDLVDAKIRSQIAPIENEFFGDFDILRDDVYTAAEFKEPYPVTALEWVQKSGEAALPVAKMSAEADLLAKALNETAVSDSNTEATISIISIVIEIGLLGFTLWVVMFRIVNPINNLSETMQLLAQGRLELEVPHIDGKDEVGDMARSVQVFKENAIERQRLTAERAEQERLELERRAEEERARLEQEAEQRDRDAQQRAQARQERRETMLNLADSFEASVSLVVEGVSQSAGNMENAARGLAGTARDTSSQATTVAEAAEQASSNANMVASAAEQLSSSVREITSQTNQSSVAARDAVERTQRASKDVAELEAAAQKIGEVVKLINDIAEQTNLLALNATIEAARAGEAGRGFAVVASEVKSLANQTASATQEISGQVEGMQEATVMAVRAMDDIKDIIVDIESTAVSIASAVEEQDASTQEIARNVAEVSHGTIQVTTNIRGVNEGAANTGTASGEVLSAAQLLTQQSTDLRREVEGFLTQIRSED